MNLLYEEEAHLFFSLVPGIGPKRFNDLVTVFKSAEKAYQANEVDLARILGSSLAHQLVHFRGSFKPQHILDVYQKKMVSILTRTNPLFPPLLKEIEDVPICLFCLNKNGRFGFNDQAIYFAVVGSRNYTSYGKSVSERITADLASSGFHIVSGLALGIDAFAHQAVLGVGGHTSAVLGCGVDVSYPPANERLRDKMLDLGNVILSEYAPGIPPSRGTFVSRNRIVSGMCRGVLIVEGTEKSGTLVTAMHAAHQGRDVFAIPGQINSPLAQAPLILLRQGAKLVTCTEDILAEYGVRKEDRKNIKNNLQLDNNQQKIVGVLRYESLHVDDVARVSGLSITQTMGILSVMEVEGLVERDGQGKYGILS